MWIQKSWMDARARCRMVVQCWSADGRGLTHISATNTTKKKLAAANTTKWSNRHLRLLIGRRRLQRVLAFRQHYSHYYFLAMARVSGKSLFFSHSLVFLAGFAAGKLVDHDELSSYRVEHESFMARFRRRAGNVAIGAVSLGAIVLFMRTTMSSSPKITN